MTSTTLAERLRELKSSSKQCKFGEIYLSMDKECQDLINQIMSVSQDEPGSVSNVNLVLTLREEGYDVGRSTVSEHRRKVCACYKNGVTK